MSDINFHELYEKIKSQVQSVHADDINKCQFPVIGKIKVMHRCYQLFLLACLLNEHRSKYKTQWEPLTGWRCIEHLLLTKTKLPPTEIKTANLSYTLLLLHSDLKEIEAEYGQKISKTLSTLYQELSEEEPWLTDGILSERFQFAHIQDEEFPIAEFHQYADWTSNSIANQHKL